MKVFLSLLLLPFTFAFAFAFAQQLDTPNYTVSIEQLCPEGEVQCQQVLYKGTSKVSGASIELKGTAWHSLCADAVTPCRFLGYQFKNGRIRYLVHESGLLQVVSSSGKVVLQEQGVWGDQQQSPQDHNAEVSSEAKK